MPPTRGPSPPLRPATASELLLLRALLATLLAIGSGCSRPVPPPSVPSPQAELSFDGVTLRLYRRGAPLVRLRSAHLELVRSTGALLARGSQFDFVLDGLTLDAPRLAGDLNTLVFDADGGVTFASRRGAQGSSFVATTPSAHLEGREGSRGVASGSEPVAVNGLQDGRPFSLRANRFRLDIEAQHATFEGVRSRVGGP